MSQFTESEANRIVNLLRIDLLIWHIKFHYLNAPLGAQMQRGFLQIFECPGF